MRMHEVKQEKPRVYCQALFSEIMQKEMLLLQFI